MRILLIESDVSAAAALGDYLEQRGHCLDYASRGVLGLRLAAATDFHSIVIADRCPVLNGSALCRQLRASLRKPPVIVLVGEGGSVEQTAAAFDAGADDYLSRPVAFAEVHARLNALSRRGRYRAPHRVVQIADLELDLSTMIACRQGDRLVLSPTELKLLRLLMEAAPHVVTHRELEACLWGARDCLSDTNLRAQVYNLRQTVDKPFERALIQTRRNLGYRIALPN